MSIPIDRLRRRGTGSSPFEPRLEEQVLEFLLNRPSEAFSLLEIIGAIRGYGSDGAAALALEAMHELQQEKIIHEYRNALGYLLLEGKVVGYDEGGVGYYAAVSL